MKYIQLISEIKKTKEYKDDPKFFNAMLPHGKVMKSTIERAEWLNHNLIERYNSVKNQKIEKQKDNESAKKVAPQIKLDEKPSDKIGQQPTNGNAGSNSFD
jgi:hypothetical protein